MNESSDPAYALIGAIVKTMTELMPGDIIGVDPADMVAVFRNAGEAFYGVGEASGEGRATRAAELALADLKRQLGNRHG